MSQRNLRQPFRSSSKVSKDTTIKAKRAIREVSHGHSYLPRMATSRSDGFMKFFWIANAHAFV